MVHEVKNCTARKLADLEIIQIFRWTNQTIRQRQKFFYSHYLYITNYARHLVPLACFLAILFADRANFFGTQTC